MDKIFPRVATRNGFAFFNQKLMEVEIQSQKISKNENGEWIISLVVSNGNDEITISPEQFYNTENDYANNTKVDVCNSYLDVFGVRRNGVYYTIENGQVVENIFDPISINVYYDEIGVEKFSCNEIDSIQKFSRKETAQEMCEFVVRKINGEEYRKEGVLHKLLLNEEQKDAVNEFVKAFEKCKEIGIDFGYSFSNERLYAWNSSKNETTTNYYKDLESDGFQIAGIEDDDLVNDFCVKMEFNYLSEEYNLGVK